MPLSGTAAMPRICISSILADCVGKTVAALLLANLLVMTAAAQESIPPVAGWIERAVLFPDRVILHAKLDTGAETTSINAAGHKSFKRDGKRWVRFSLTSRGEETVNLERPRVRTATIKRLFGIRQKRPVIELDLCIGSVRKTVEVTLVDRTGLDYQLLIGRNFLEDDLLVSSGSTYSLPPDCPDNETDAENRMLQSR